MLYHGFDRQSDMRPFQTRASFTTAVAILVLLETTALAPGPYIRSPISADEFADDLGAPGRKYPGR